MNKEDIAKVHEMYYKAMKKMDQCDYLVHFILLMKLKIT